MTRSRQVAAGVFALLGVFAIVESRQLPYYTSNGPGPGFFPLWIGIALAVVSTIHLVQLLVPHRAASRRTAHSALTRREAANPDPSDQVQVPGDVDAAMTGDRADDPSEELMEAQPTSLWPGRASAARVAIVLCAILYVALTLESFGFTLSMFTMLVVVLLTLGRQKPWVTAVVAAVGSVAVYLVFTRWLQVQLPPSPIPWLSALGL